MRKNIQKYHKIKKATGTKQNPFEDDMAGDK